MIGGVVLAMLVLDVYGVGCGEVVVGRRCRVSSASFHLSTHLISSHLHFRSCPRLGAVPYIQRLVQVVLVIIASHSSPTPPGPVGKPVDSHLSRPRPRPSGRPGGDDADGPFEPGFWGLGSEGKEVRSYLWRKLSWWYHNGRGQSPSAPRRRCCGRSGSGRWMEMGKCGGPDRGEVFFAGEMGFSFRGGGLLVLMVRCWRGEKRGGMLG